MGIKHCLMNVVFCGFVPAKYQRKRLKRKVKKEVNDAYERASRRYPISYEALERHENGEYLPGDEEYEWMWDSDSQRSLEVFIELMLFRD